MPSINHLLTIAILLSAALLPISCNKQRDKQGEQYSTHRAEMETIAQQRLVIAREQLKDDNCQAAKSSIEAMRHDCYLALTARQQGILLMDSVELRQAQLDLARVDSLMQHDSSQGTRASFEEACQKVQFYERKLQFDKQRK